MTSKRQGARLASQVLVFVVLLGVGAHQSSAQYAAVTSRAALGGDDNLNWGVLGGSATDVGNPLVIASSVAGLPVNVSQQQTSLLRRVDQPAAWAGDFANFDQLLWSGNGVTRTTPNPMTFVFPGGVVGGGTQFQANLYGAFVAQIRGFDVNGSLLAGSTFSRNGNSTALGDNSAIFLGLRNTSGAANIFRIELRVISPPDVIGDFAINRFDFIRAPEPGTGLLAAVGVGIVGAVRRRRRSVEG